MNNEQAQLALENIGSKIKLVLAEEEPTFSIKNERMGYVAYEFIEFLTTGSYLKYRLSDEEFAILTQLSKTRKRDRVPEKQFNKFVDNLSKADEPTRTKIINYVKELISNDNRRES
ncbi:hypothetical protein [Liquorilactobacillus mali]|uniref:Uncharacterized protein n=1 Tax=Liquorilactobacillus mali TaxID=1618 RepID=A0A0R2FRX9_9LACO|nr:hypothetical protein [Liquorilactobacillus mali]KRN31128.1 hypothetical protein IV36_GL001936 [Liquorilactobacillus mali]